jgi:DNA-binding transcriptional MocR family regulator
VDIRSLILHFGSWSAGKGSLQLKLARAIARAIQHGVLNPGVRLPSERALARALTISRTTVVAAYDDLKEARWIQSRAGSGTRVCHRSSVVGEARHAAHTAALAASPLVDLLQDRDERHIIDFALGAPLPLDGLSPELFTVPPDEYVALVRDRQYHPFGMLTLRQAVAAHYCELGLDTTPQQVLVTNGAQQALSLCAALYLQRGDAALVEDPAYFGALDVFRAVGARMSTVSVDPSGASPGAIRDRIRVTGARLVYLTPTFQNPTGAVMSTSMRKGVAAIVSELGTPVIDDRTMADLILEGVQPPPLAAYAPNAAVLTIGSLSKLIWPGLRIGWIRAPAPIIERLVRLKSATDLASPLVTQAIALRLLGAVDQARTLRRTELKPKRDLLATLLRKQLPDWSFRLPAGGLFLWTRVPAGDVRDFAQVALRYGIIVMPGPSMSAAGEHSEFLRLPFLAAPHTIREAVTRLAAAWRNYTAVHRDNPTQRLAIV